MKYKILYMLEIWKISFTIYYLHGLINEGTIAKIDKPEEEPVIYSSDTFGKRKKIARITPRNSLK